MKKERHVQLGLKTASYKLNKDILFKFIIEAGHNCFRCGGTLTRDNFSIDHKIPWLNKENAVELFFDLDNIAFSHRICNSKAARKPHKKYSNKKECDAHYHKTRVRVYDKEQKKCVFIRKRNPT